MNGRGFLLRRPKGSGTESILLMCASRTADIQIKGEERKMSRFCPLKGENVIYPVCQECKEKVCNLDDVFALLVCGSRSVTENDNIDIWISAALNVPQQKYKHVLVVEGGAAGADMLARKYAIQHNLHLKEIPADWEKYGKSAGIIRNKAMHGIISKYPHRGVIAFWDGKSKGTAQNFGLARQYNNPLFIVHTGYTLQPDSGRKYGYSEYDPHSLITVKKQMQEKCHLPEEAIALARSERAVWIGRERGNRRGLHIIDSQFVNSQLGSMAFREDNNHLKDLYLDYMRKLSNIFEKVE